MTEIFRSYQLKNHSNQNKLDLLMDVLDMYRISPKQISNKQWDKKNRKTQSEFECKCCGLKINADVNASRNHVFRSSEYDYKSRSKILQTLTELNGVWRGQRGHSSAKDFKPIKV